MAYGSGIRRHGAANYFQVIDTADAGDTVRHDVAHTYQINELVSRVYREQIDLRLHQLAIHQALLTVFGAELENIIVEQPLYADKLKQRGATSKESGKLGWLNFTGVF